MSINRSSREELLVKGDLCVAEEGVGFESAWWGLVEFDDQPGADVGNVEEGVAVVGEVGESRRKCGVGRSDAACCAGMGASAVGVRPSHHSVVRTSENTNAPRRRAHGQKADVGASSPGGSAEDLSAARLLASVST